ncbi:MAG: hypothetical protein ACREN4_08405 [Candidatus Dormibacteria bacterium]
MARPQAAPPGRDSLLDLWTHLQQRSQRQNTHELLRLRPELGRLPLAQIQVLALIPHEGMPEETLRTALGGAEALTSLLRRRLLRRETDGAQGPQMRLTEKGKELRQAIDQVQRGSVVELAERLSQEQREQLQQLLLKVVEHLG